MVSASLAISQDTATDEVAEVRNPAGRLTQKAYLNGLAALLDYSAKVVVTSLITPVLVAGLGSSLFGVWQILSKLITYISAADGRPTQALKWVIANQQSINNDELKRRQVGSALGVWLLFLPILIALGTVLVWFVPMITKVPGELYSTVRYSCALLVINLLLTNLIALPESVLRGMNLGYKRMGLQAGLNVVGGAITVGAIYLGLGLIGVTAAQVVLTGLTGVLFWLVVKKYVAWFGIIRPSFRDVRSFLTISNWWLAWSWITKVMMASDVVILGIMASASVVTSYALTSYAGLAVLSASTVMIGAATPGLGGVIGSNNFEKASRLREEMMTASWLFVTAAGSTILLWNRSFVFLWVGQEHYAGFWPNLLIVLLVAQLVFIRNHTYIIDLTLKMRKKVIVGSVAVALSIGLSALLIPLLGITGLCLGMLAGRMLLTIYYPTLVNSYLGNAQARAVGNFRRQFQRGVSMGLFFAVSAYLGEQLQTQQWTEWIGGTIVTFGVMFLIALVTGLRSHERACLFNRFRSIRAFRSA
jgi:O-antigen/teichoic acid export membrane protein